MPSLTNFKLCMEENLNWDGTTISPQTCTQFNSPLQVKATTLQRKCHPQQISCFARKKTRDGARVCTTDIAQSNNITEKILSSTNFKSCMEENPRWRHLLFSWDQLHCRPVSHLLFSWSQLHCRPVSHLLFSWSQLHCRPVSHLLFSWSRSKSPGRRVVVRFQTTCRTRPAWWWRAPAAEQNKTKLSPQVVCAAQAL